LTQRGRWVAILVAIAGAGVCFSLLVGFVMTIVHNELPWSPEQTVQEHYLAVGDSYSRGFTVGFFLCFFLTIFAVSASSLLERRGRSRPAARALRSDVTVETGS
jgi:hypothetical protein